MSLINFSNVKEQTPGFKPLPEGFYNVISDDAVIKQTKSGGEMINIKFRVLDGEYAGRFIFQSFTIKNDNPKAVEIGLSQLKSFIRCAGLNIEVLNDVLDLVAGKVSAKVKIQPDTGYGEQNKISYFKELEAVKNYDSSNDLPM